MKARIKYKSQYSIGFSDNGEFVDLRVTESHRLKAGQPEMLSLGIAMQIPKDFEAIVVPRSSTFKNYGIMLSNSVGVIDSSYCGDDDVWRFPAYPTRDTEIPPLARIAQFSIRPSQKAGLWTKIKWLFTSGIEFEKVASLGNPSRGGFGTTGKI